jgi:hypothetical protein
VWLDGVGAWGQWAGLSLGLGGCAILIGAA